MAGNKLIKHLQVLEIHERNKISVYLISFLTLLQPELFIHSACKSIMYDKLMKIVMARR
jgi:hypothetical protein